MNKCRIMQPTVTIFLMFTTFVLLAVVPPVFAVDPPPPEGEPAFSNPAQAAHAENLAEASAAQAEAAAAEAVAEADRRRDALDRAQEAFDNLPADATQADIDAAQAALDDAQDVYDAAVENADDRLAGIGGTSVEEISALRESGMGWGEIAHELGVHPSALGLGHTKMKNWKHGHQGELAGEVAEATQRDLKNGGAKGHAGKGNNGDGGDNGGIGKDSAPGQGKDRGNSGKGNSGKGNSGKGNK